MMLMSVCLLDDLILGFCHCNLRREPGGLELASSITLALQASRLTKCASHPKSLFYLFNIIVYSRIRLYSARSN